MKILFLLILFCAHLSANIIDLERDLLDESILETKRIHIPGFPYAFNPSMIRWNGGYLLSFRAGKSYIFDEAVNDTINNFPDESFFLERTDAPRYSPNRMGLIWLDENFNPISRSQLLDIPNNNPVYRQQDPRLVTVGDRIYMVYSDIVDGVFIAKIRRVFVTEIHFEDGRFYPKNTECLAFFEGAAETRTEKNWTPFDYENKLLLAYSINPHKILYPLLGDTNICNTIASTEKQIDWKWGTLRGGSQALLIGEDSYLSFFHSSIVMESVQSGGKKMQHYFMGAYTFSSHPPFELLSMSPAPIVGKDFYNGPKYQTWKPLMVVYPGGFITRGKHIYIAYGRQDHEIWIAKVDQDRLLKSLVPVRSIP